MTSEDDSSISEYCYGYTNKALEPPYTQDDEDMWFLHDAKQVFEELAPADDNFSEDNSTHTADLAERDSAAFFDRDQMRLHHPDDPWSAWTPNCISVGGELSYLYRAGVEIPAAAGNYCDRDVFRFSESIKSKSTFYTAPSELGSAAVRKHKPRLEKDSEYAQILAKKNVWPVDTSIEQDWSGRGQHVEFQEHEGEVVDEILQVQDVIGRTNSAIVESVKCRRILLARKTIVCRRRIKKEEVIDEFAILNRLTHSHVVRVIGTYTLGREMSILMYPVAEFDLQDVLYAFEFSEVEESKKNKESEEEDSMIADMAYSALGYFACLSNALDHIHHKLVKHMDIKPRNILVRTVINSSPELQKREYKVYFTDFGISRSYQNSEDVETDGLTNFTRKYAAPEVISQESRGFQADIFSLGCVFLEIFAYLFDYFGRGKNETHPPARQDIQKILATNTSGLSSYYANIARLERYVISNEWTLFLKQHSILSARLPPDTVTLVRQMFSLDPKLRPTAKQLVAQFGVSLCCVLGCETLEATSKEHQDTIPEIQYARAGAWVESR